MDDKCLVWCTYRSGMPYPRRRPRTSNGAADGGVASSILDALRALPEALHAMVAYTRLEPPPAHASVGGFSDAGWGCTVRSTQMLAASALLRARAAAGERVDRADVARLLVDWPPGCGGSGDDGGDDVTGALSLPAFVVAGRAMSGKPAGAWYGPHEACHVLQRLAAAGTRGGAGMRLRGSAAVGLGQGDGDVDGDGIDDDCDERRLAVVVCNDATVVRADVLAAAAGQGTGANKQSSGCDAERTRGGWRHPVLALVPLLLGLERTVPPCRLPALAAHMRLPSFAGALGGWPRHSVFITGLAEGGDDGDAGPGPGGGGGGAGEGNSNDDDDDDDVGAPQSPSQGQQQQQQQLTRLRLRYLDPHVVQATPAPPAPTTATAAAAARPVQPQWTGCNPNGDGADTDRGVLPPPPLPQWYVDSLTPPPAGRPGAPPGPLDGACLDPCLALAFLLGSPAELDEFTAAVARLARAGLQLFAVVDAPLRPPADGGVNGGTGGGNDADGGVLVEDDDGCDVCVDRGVQRDVRQRRFQWLREPELEAGARSDEGPSQQAGGLRAVRARSSASLVAPQRQQLGIDKDGAAACTAAASPPGGRRCRSEPLLQALSLGARRSEEGDASEATTSPAPAAAPAAAATPLDSPPSPAAPSSPYVDVAAAVAPRAVGAAGGSPGDGSGVLVALPGTGAPLPLSPPTTGGGRHAAHVSRGSWTELPPPAAHLTTGIVVGGGDHDGSAPAPTQPPAAAALTALKLLTGGGGGGSGMAPSPPLPLPPPPPLQLGGGRVHHQLLLLQPQLQKRYGGGGGGGGGTPTPTTASSTGGRGGGSYDDAVLVVGPTPGGGGGSGTVVAPTPYDMLAPSEAAPTPSRVAESAGEGEVAASPGAAADDDADSGDDADTTPQPSLARSTLAHLLPPPPLLPPSPASTTASAADTAGTGSTRSVAAPRPATPTGLRPGRGSLLLPPPPSRTQLHPRMARSEGPPRQAAETAPAASAAATAGGRRGGSAGSDAGLDDGGGHVWKGEAAATTAWGRPRAPLRSSPLLLPSTPVTAAAVAAAGDAGVPRRGQLLR